MKIGHIANKLRIALKCGLNSWYLKKYIAPDLMQVGSVCIRVMSTDQVTYDFRSYNVIYIVYDHKNENHWSLLIIRYLLLITNYLEYKHPMQVVVLLASLSYTKSVTE